jgi:magnesium transporter
MKSLFTIKEGKIITSTEDEANIRIYVAPDANEKAEIIEQFGIDNNDLDSALDPDEISRVEFLHKCTSIIWKNPTSPDIESVSHFEVSTVGFFINNDALTIILSEESSLLSEKIFEKVNSINDVMLRFFLYTIRQYLSNLKKIKQITSKIEGNLITSAENKYFLQMFDISERLVYYVNAIEGNSAVLAKLRANTEKLNLSQHQIYYLDDIIHDNAQSGRQSNIHSSVLSGLMDARGNVINNNMNVLLRSLTMITVVFMPLNLLAGMGGMSEFTMMLNEYKIPWQIGYLCFAAAMFVIGWLMWIFLKKYIGNSGNVQ